MSKLDDFKTTNSASCDGSPLSQLDPQNAAFALVLPVFREIVEGNLSREIHRDRERSIEFYPEQMELFVRNCRDRIIARCGEDDSIDVKYLSKLCTGLENLIKLASTELPEAWCSRTADWFKNEFSEHLDKSSSHRPHVRFNESPAAQK